MLRNQQRKPAFVERRKHTRVDFRINAEIKYGDKTYRGFIENFSETGIFKVVFPQESMPDLVPGKAMKIIFQVPSGKEFHLSCIIKWLRIYTDSPSALKYNMGMEISNPPQDYREFVRQLIVNQDIPVRRTVFPFR